jgi:3-methyladenine DNA glycosylase AlkD
LKRTVALYLSGPVWAAGRISDQTIVEWASLRSTEEDRWWRRAALVSTVPLSRQGLTMNIPKTLRACALLVPDRDDMIVKALSWALRELARRHKDAARRFLDQNRQTLAPRGLLLLALSGTLLSLLFGAPVANRV